ncbi:MAG: GGDEF domain-containing protein [Nitrospirae bacterium]|nr:GGDEF domain-containing protein [Nitrospirota bacterium]
MTALINSNPLFLITILAVGCLVALLVFISGKKIGAAQERKCLSNSERVLFKESALLSSKTQGFQRELENLKKQNEKYLYFLVRLPEAVKRLNTNLSFDEIIATTVRLIKELSAPSVIELYLFNQSTNSLELTAALGSDKKKSVEVKIGEGIIGMAALNKTLVFKDKFSQSPHDKNIEIGMPMLFKDVLIGVIGVGKISMQSDNEKRFLAMIADLTAISLQTSESLSTAKKEAITDSLTGLYNKRHFLDKALEIVRKATNYTLPFSVFICDLDHFKNYNDKNGHVEGDILLKELAKLIKQNTRSTCIAARYGGEEFIVLLPDIDKKGTMLYAERLRKLIEDYPFLHREKQLLGCISISGGVATFPLDGNTVDAVIKNADTALSQSKTAGRNRITPYEPPKLS